MAYVPPSGYGNSSQPLYTSSGSGNYSYTSNTTFSDGRPQHIQHSSYDQQTGQHTNYDSMDSFNPNYGLQKSNYSPSKPFLDDQTKRESLFRLLLGAPLLALGGAFATLTLGLISPIVITPLAGAFAGAVLAIAHVFTNIMRSRFELNEVSHGIVEIIVDIALAALATYATCYYLGAPLTLVQTALIVPLAVLGTGVLALGSIGMLIAGSLLLEQGFGVQLKK